MSNCEYDVYMHYEVSTYLGLLQHVLLAKLTITLIKSTLHNFQWANFLQKAQNN